MKRILSSLLIILLTAVLFALPASADDSVKIYAVRSPEFSPTDEDGFPLLSDTPAVNWIDRIGTLPDHVMAFYRWLAAESTADGALADPQKGEHIIHSDGSDAYVHPVKISGKIAFELPEHFNYGNLDAYINRVIAEELPRVTDINFNYTARALVSAENAFDRDHPEVFWLIGASSWNSRAHATAVKVIGRTVYISYTQSVDYYLQRTGFDIRAEKYRDPEIIREHIGIRDQAAEKIISAIPEGYDTVKILRHFNRRLTIINGYNTSEDLLTAENDTRECISALTGRTGETGPVCEGYARAFKVLCDLTGIPCVLTDGYARYEGDEEKKVLHIWNLVCPEPDSADPLWYAVDVTWNDPLVKNSTNALSGQESEKWFLTGKCDLIGGMLFSVSHEVRNQVTDPGLLFLNGPHHADFGQ